MCGKAEIAVHLRGPQTHYPQGALDQPQGAGEEPGNSITEFLVSRTEQAVEDTIWFTPSQGSRQAVAACPGRRIRIGVPQTLCVRYSMSSC